MATSCPPPPVGGPGNTGGEIESEAYYRGVRCEFPEVLKTVLQT